MKAQTIPLSKPAAATHRQVLVVAGLLWRGPTLLVQQRPPDRVLPLLWEFPGGKVEPEETCEAALVRECSEELGVDIDVGALAWTAIHEGSQQRVQLQFYHAHLADDAAPIRATSAVQWAWLRPADMLELPFCPADVALVQALARGGIVPATR